MVDVRADVRFALPVLLAAELALVGCSSDGDGQSGATDGGSVADAETLDGQTAGAGGTNADIDARAADGSSRGGLSGAGGSPGVVDGSGSVDGEGTDALADGSQNNDAGDGASLPRTCSTDCAELTAGCATGRCNTVLGVCEVALLPDTTSCDDRNPCTEATMCAAGECAGGSTTCALPTGILFGSEANAPLVGFEARDFADACPMGQVLIGWNGSYAPTVLYLAQVTGVCGTLELVWSEADQAYLAVATAAGTLPSHGQAFFATFERACPDGEVVVGLAGGAIRRGAVTSFVVSCAQLRVVYNGGWQVEVGTPHSLPSPISTSTTSDRSFDGACPEGEVAVGQYGGFDGSLIGGIGVICGAPAVE